MNTRDPVDILARTLWGEARNQGRIGMQAVAAVVLNRARDKGWWGDDVLHVCLAPMQFSCWNWNCPERPAVCSVTGANPAFVTALAVAEDAVAGRLVDPTHGADSYFAAGTPEPAWARGREPCAVIGQHRFYRLEGSPVSNGQLSATTATDDIEVQQPPLTRSFADTVAARGAVDPAFREALEADALNEAELRRIEAQ